MGLRSLTSVADACAALQAVTPRLTSQRVPLQRARGRYLADDVYATQAMPQAPRSAMDGFAVRAVDVAHACRAMPVRLSIVGEVVAGAQYEGTLLAGQAVRIPTGGCLPAGTDAIVPVENVVVQGAYAAVVVPSAAGRHVVAAGDDVRVGQALLAQGQRLYAPQMAVLAAAGHPHVNVAAQPRVTLFSSGAEVCPPEQTPTPAQVRDVNQTLLGALCEAAGALVTYGGIIADDLAALTQAIEAAVTTSDVILLSAGTSVGVRDFAAAAVAAVPGTRLLFHGVNMRPGKPTLAAYRPGPPPVFICGLPGFPMSATVAFAVFVAPVLARLQGGAGHERTPPAVAILTEPYQSSVGREDYVRVALTTQPDGPPLATPLSAGPALVTGLLQMEGFVKVRPETETLPAGALVHVLPLDL